MALPFFPFYVRDWLSSASVDAMTLAEKGSYIQLLAKMWENAQNRGACVLPADDRFLARTLHVTDAEWADLRAVLVDGPSAVFRVDGAHLLNDRLLREWENAQDVSEKRSAAAKASHASRAPSNSPANADQMQSSSTASHIPHAQAQTQETGDISTDADASTATRSARAGKRKRADKTTDPRVRPVIDRFAELHQAQIGRPYAVVGGRDGERIRALPKAIELDKLLSYVDEFFARSRDDPFLRNKGLTIPLFVSYVPTLQRQEADRDGVVGGRTGEVAAAGSSARFSSGLYQQG